jgi:hypothetical protein
MYVVVGGLRSEREITWNQYTVTVIYNVITVIKMYIDNNMVN